MKGLILHCKSFTFKDIENSTKPNGIVDTLNDRELTQGHFEHRVVVLACVEEPDSEEIIENAANHVNHMISEWHSNNKDVIVLPFGHLSKDIAQPPKSKDLIHLFANKLKESGNNVELITFGSHKEWSVDVYGYPRATSWFQFP